MTREFIKQRTLQEQSDVLAQYLPGGPLFLLKNKVATNEAGLRVPFEVPAQIGTPINNLDNSNWRKLLNGLAPQFNRYRETINEMFKQLDPTVTDVFLREWETLLGLPDNVLTETRDPDLRRLQILIRLATLGASTKEDFERIGTVAGVSVVARPKTSGAGARETIIFDIAGLTDPGALTLTLPFILGDNLPNQLIDLFKEIVPLQCGVEINFV